MADPKGTDPKDPTGTPVTSKPDSVKSGPVKPPVLDLKARPSETKPDPKVEPKKPEPSKDLGDKPKPSDSPFGKPASPVPPAPARSGFAFGAAVAGGVLGLAAAYGLAWAGLWPSVPATAPAADPRLAQFGSAIPELQTVTDTTQSELATLTRRVAAVEARAPNAAPAAATTATPAPTDLTPLEDQLAALTTRIDTLAATPAAASDTAALESLRTDITGFTTRLDELGARLGTAESNLRDLDTTVAETSATLASQPTDIGAVLQLPLILSGFEAAFSTGRPYETELASLRAALPTATIPTEIANAATSGLPRPDVIAQRFADVLPAIIAGRPAEANAGWQDGAMDWFRSAIALRPTGELEGDSPEAVVSRLEGAIARRDFATAQTLLAALPAPMQTAAGEIPQLVASQAAAASFLDTLRAQALNGEAKP